MISLSPEAKSNIDALIVHYENLGRVEASLNLLDVLNRAKIRISQQPEAGLRAPRPYPALAKPGRRWIIEGPYWIAYSLTKPPVIAGVYYATADISTDCDATVFGYNRRRGLSWRYRAGTV